MRDRTEKMIGGVSVLLLLFMVTRWKLFEYAALILWIVHLGSYLRRERKANLVTIVSAKYCYAAHESRLHQNDRCKRFALCLVLTVRFRSLAPWGKLFQLFI